MHTLAGIIGPIGTPELIVILIIGLLIFGRRLPEVGKSLGKGIVEFRKGLKGIEEEVEAESTRSTRLPDRDKVGAPPPLTPGAEDVRVSRSPAVGQQASPGAEPHAAG